MNSLNKYLSPVLKNLKNDKENKRVPLLDMSKVNRNLVKKFEQIACENDLLRKQNAELKRTLDQVLHEKHLNI